jgi:hypothetical protein
MSSEENLTQAERAIYKELQDIKRDFYLNNHELTIIIIKNLQKVIAEPD